MLGVKPNRYQQMTFKMLTARGRRLSPKTKEDAGEAEAKVAQVVRVALRCLHQLQGRVKRDLAPRTELVAKMRGQGLKAGLGVKAIGGMVRRNQKAWKVTVVRTAKIAD